MMPSQEIVVGSIWKGRGLEIRMLRVGLAIVLIERLDISSKLPETYRVHPWLIESMRGMVQVS